MFNHLLNMEIKTVLHLKVNNLNVTQNTSKDKSGTIIWLF